MGSTGWMCLFPAAAPTWMEERFDPCYFFVLSDMAHFAVCQLVQMKHSSSINRDVAKVGI